jgi:predicted transcriptional regulator
MVRYRNRLDIIADVLEVAKSGARKTKIMYGANLSYTLLTRYLKDVLDLGLVKGEDGNIFKLTEKGSDFLQEFNGYREHRGEIEEQLSDIEYEKTMLLNKFLNDEGAR